MKKFNGKELFRRFQKLALVSHDNRWKRNLYNTGILNTIVVLNSCRLVSKKKSYKYGPITDSSLGMPQPLSSHVLIFTLAMCPSYRNVIRFAPVFTQKPIDLVYLNIA